MAWAAICMLDLVVLFAGRLVDAGPGSTSSTSSTGDDGGWSQRDCL